MDPVWSIISIVALVLLGGLLFWGFVSRFFLTTRRDRLVWNWFLPTLRRSSRGPMGYGPIGSLVHGKLPNHWISNRDTKKRGAIRWLLRKLGASWLASPVRRGIQAVCWLTFLLLFLVTCWPYSARPVSRQALVRISQFKEVVPGTGEFVFEVLDEIGTQAFPSIVYLCFYSNGKDEVEAVFQSRITKFESRRVHMEVDGSAGELLEKVLTATRGTWNLYAHDPQEWPTHYAVDLERKEWLPAEFFLAIDPLVSLSTSLAARQWVWSISCAGLILAVCVFIPRAFCGYFCPLGTTIDLFDWLISQRIKRFRISGSGWWVHIKYYLLAGVLIAAVRGVLLSGYVSAIPVVTRAALLVLEPLQSGLLRGWRLVPGIQFEHLISLILFMVVLGLGLLQPRFWCKYVCPSGAVFSVFNVFRLTHRHVEKSCIHCNKCVEVCPFDAIKSDFTTRGTDCTFCQTCAGVCPTQAIKFVERGNRIELKVLNEPPTEEGRLGRRGFLSLAGGSSLAVAGGLSVSSLIRPADDLKSVPVRPPGSVPESEFLQLCIRCGECFKACPNNVLQLQGLEHGLSGLWSPHVNADWAGCESSCNACGQVCPTGAIRSLPMEEKSVTRMGLAIVDPETCLPFVGREACDLCVQECQTAGYHAIEYIQVGTQTDRQGQPMEGTGFLAPVVLEDKCVGCGLCQTRCFGINVKDRHLLGASAIVIQAGENREDRLPFGQHLPEKRWRRNSFLHRDENRQRWLPVDEPETQSAEVPAELDFGENPFGL